MPDVCVALALAGGIVLISFGQTLWARLIAAIALAVVAAGAFPIGAAMLETHVAFALLAGSIVTFGGRASGPLAIAAAAVGILGGVQFLYGAGAPDTLLPRMPGTRTVAVLLLAGGLLAGRVQARALIGRGPGAALARALLPALLVLPILFGWLRFEAERAGLIDMGTGLALMVTAMILLVLLLVAHQARTLDGSDAKVRATSRLLDATFDAIPDMVHVKDARSLAFVSINRAGEELLGMRREELTGKTDRELFDAEQAAAIQELDRRALRSGALLDIHEEPMATPRGERWLHTRKVVIAGDDGRPTHLLGISEDITDRREDERRLRLWASVFQHARWGVVVVRADGTLDLMNPAWASMHGYELNELGDKPLEHVFAPGSRGDILAQLGVAALEGNAAFESRHLRKDGSTFPALVSLIAIEGGGLAVHAQDVTELKRSEEALRRAKETAEATSKELEAFSYSVSHDLRAPLRAIDGFSTALAEDYADALDSTARDYLGRVRTAAQRMAQLIDDLIQLSRVARHDFARDRVDLGAIAIDVARELSEANPARRVAFRTIGDLTTQADSRLVRVALTNLLENAWKFTGQRSAAHVELGRATDGHFYVRDDGVGFDMIYAKKLFGAFQRLHSVNEFPGTGIGLATVQRIVHRHGGRVWAEGRIGEGATFHFTLPARTPEEMS